MSYALKKKVDLSTVTAAPPPVEREAPDTTTPIEKTIERFTALHLAKWGPWLLARLQQHWPHLTAYNYTGILAEHMRSNESLLIKTKRAIMLAVVTKETFTPRPFVDVVFIFKFHPTDAEENKYVRPMIRHAETWGRAKGARYLRLKDVQHTDLADGQAKEIVGAAAEPSYFLKDLDK